MEQFDDCRKKMNISRGLEKLGDTRFGILYWVGKSVLRGLPALKAIAEDETLQIKIPVSNASQSTVQLYSQGHEKGLSHATEALQLEIELTRLVEIIGPFAKSIKCLESSHSTAADVFVFWLATIAHLDQLFRDDKLGIPGGVKEDIRAITNRRFNGMINNGPTDIYLTAFVLNPSMPCCDLIFQWSCSDIRA
jgi:hypothetical protein